MLSSSRLSKQVALGRDTIAYSLQLDLDGISIKLPCIHHDDMNTHDVV